MPAIMIAAVKSGSGKTTIACAMMQALKNKGRDIIAYKCGPDYIDPMFHERVIGIPSRNLDTFFSDAQQIRELYGRNSREGRLAVIEGVMGLFDGLGGTGEEGSAYHLAQALDIPVVLVLDAHGMGRTMIPVLAGMLQYDVDHRICGVLLNRTTGSFYQRIAPVIEKELSLPVLGFFPKIRELTLESRHLGLKLPEEIEDLQRQLNQAASVLEESVELDRITELAGKWKRPWEEPSGRKTKPAVLNKIRIGIARDEAFCFYYEDNLRLLKEAGGELVYFSPLRDSHLPKGLHGLILGGGYPELKMKELSANMSMRKDISLALKGGMPSLAECGGFMYLHQYMEAEDGQRYPMVGAVPGIVKNTGRLVRFGYIELYEKKACFLPEGSSIKGHEFHYFDSSCNGADCRAQKPVGEKSWDCVHMGENYWWGFPHLYYPSNPDFVRKFIEKCRIYSKEQASYANIPANEESGCAAGTITERC